MVKLLEIKGHAKRDFFNSGREGSKALTICKEIIMKYYGRFVVKITQIY